jgi:ubiquinone/menaquinone biosynthesis C-methylase UbiE
MSNPAETYESYMVPPLFGPAAQRLVEAANPRSGERVLDLACGTGVVARRVVATAGPDIQITGLDLNPNMLAVARAVSEREGLAIDWREGRAEAIPLPDNSFDLALCQFGLMFFADRPAALREMHRVVAPGGRAAVSVWQGLERHPFYRTLHEVIERRIGVSSLADIFSLGDTAELRELLSGAGFRDVRIEPSSLTARFPDPESFLAGEIDVDTAAIPAMQSLSEIERREITSAIQEEMAAPLREVTVGDHVEIPFHAHLGMALR